MLDIVKIDTQDLEPGMYISSLDRPWVETPFSLQGFRLNSETEVRRLQEYCDYVYVDSSKSAQDAAILRRKVRSTPKSSHAEVFHNRTLKSYADSATWEEEYPRALKAVMELSRGIETVLGKLVDNCSLDMVTVKKSVEPMVESICRNPGPCIWLARLKQENNYNYQHPLGASIWAVALGRQIGLPKTDLRSLAIGGILFDIGKLGLDPELLETTRKLSEEEVDQVRGHVKMGLDMIQGSTLMNSDVIDMITHHHERHDGSGYPKGLRGTDIPVFARLISIVDCYDAITSHRGYARAISPAEAVRMMNDWKDIDFQGELVEEFIQTVGVYPAGTVVELSNGEVGVVMVSDRRSRLRPRVMVILDADKKELPEPRTINLAEQAKGPDAIVLEIRDSLEPGAHGIELSKLPI